VKNSYILQAKHNEKFHDCICEQFPDRFFDWKITILFYQAIHYLKALAFQKNINIGDTHFEIEQNVNPDRPKNKMSLTKGAWRDYNALFHYSQTARYNGITDFETFEKLKEADYFFAKQNLEKFKRYLLSVGLKLEE
jgi:hypothetical protein